jgi:hypothetical protein
MKTLPRALVGRTVPRGLSGAVRIKNTLHANGGFQRNHQGRQLGPNALEVSPVTVSHQIIKIYQKTSVVAEL